MKDNLFMIMSSIIKTGYAIARDYDNLTLADCDYLSSLGLNIEVNSFGFASKRYIYISYPQNPQLTQK